MARSWLWLTLGTAVVLAASCSSSGTKQAPPARTPAGGDAEAGATPSDVGGNIGDEGGAGATPASSGSAGAATDAGGQAAGGDTSSEMTDGWLNGTRLRAVVQVAGSSKLFKGWHDTELDVDCRFQFDPDGTERCVPSEGNGYLQYSDAKCTKLVAIVDSTRPLPAWLPEPTAFKCRQGPAYRTVGATVAVTDTYSIDQTGACIPGGTIGGTQITKAVGAVVPTTTFVAATKEVREARDPRLAANVRVAADGSREVTSHFDLERQADCSPRDHAGDGMACVPLDRAYIEALFADAACDAPAAYRPAYANQNCDKTAPDIIQDSRPWFTDEYFEVGKAFTGSLYRKTPACQPYISVFEPGATFFAVGKPIAWASLAQLSTKNEGAGRIALRVTRGSDAELITREAFFDTTIGAVCQEVLTSDLKTRCAPYSPIQVSDFADDKCTQGLLAYTAGVTPIVQADFAQAAAAAGGETIFKRGAKVATPAKLWQANWPDCIETTPSASFDYYATTTIAPSEMVLLTFETE
jgi:hypothetical protein